jgi:hypothetical protein
MFLVTWRSKSWAGQMFLLPGATMIRLVLCLCSVLPGSTKTRLALCSLLPGALKIRLALCSFLPGAKIRLTLCFLLVTFQRKGEAGLILVGIWRCKVLLPFYIDYVTWRIFIIRYLEQQYFKAGLYFFTLHSIHPGQTPALV